MDIATAIKSLFPEAEFVIKDNDYNELQWISEDIPKPTWKQLEARWEELQRDQARGRIRELRREYMYAGIVFCGVEYSTDADSRGLIAGAALDAEDLESHEIVDWQAPQPDGSHAWQDLEAVRVRALQKAVAHYTRRLYQVQRAKERAFDAGEDAQDIPWPSPIYDCTEDLGAVVVDASNAASELGDTEHGSQERGTVMVGIG